MSTSPRRWTSLAIAGTAISFAAAPLQAQDLLHNGPDRIWLAQAEAGEGGEAGILAERDDDAAYVAALGFIEGHLRVGVALYEAGAGRHGYHPYEASAGRDLRGSGPPIGRTRRVSL